MTLLRLTQSRARGSSRNSCSIEGTKWIVVMPCSMIVCARYVLSRWPPGSATTSSAPKSSGQKNSQTETSKLNGVFWRTLSVRCQLEIFLHPVDAIGDGLVRDHGALGPAGRSRGVDHVGQTVGSDPWGAAARPSLVQFGRRDLVDREDAGPRIGEAAGQVSLRQQDRAGEIVEHEGDAVRRVLRIDGRVGAAGPEDGMERDDHLDRAIHAHRHHRSLLDAELGQASREAADPVVELGVAERLAAEGESRRGRRARGLRREDLVKERLGVGAIGPVPLCGRKNDASSLDLSLHVATLSWPMFRSAT